MALSTNALNALTISLANYGATVEIASALDGLSQTVTTATITTANITTANITTENVTTLNTVALVMSASTADLTVIANTAAAFDISDGTTNIVRIDTRNTVTGVNAVTINAPPATIASAATNLTNPALDVAARTVTLTGVTTTTSLLGVGARFEQPTVTDASVCTLTTLSNVHIATNAAAGGSLTITNTRMISTGVSDCFLTNAGVWTDTACWEYGKEMVSRVTGDAYAMIDYVLDNIVPATWQYRSEFDVVDPEGKITRMQMNDRGRHRVGTCYDDLPDCLRAPGEDSGVSVGVLASFCLAALKKQGDELKALKNLVMG